MKPHIRWMIRRDLIEVVEIENQSFEHPMSGGEFLSELRKLNVIGVVAENATQQLMCSLGLTDSMRRVCYMGCFITHTKMPTLSSDGLHTDTTLLIESLITWERNHDRQ